MRSRLLRARWTGALAAGRPADAPEPAPASAYDPEWAARILLAATDGLQLQWLLDPSIDMAADMGRLRDLLLDVLERADTDSLRDDA